MKNLSDPYKVTLEIPAERVASLLVSAFEGGSNYWYTIKDRKIPHGSPMDWDFRLDKNDVFPHVDFPMNEGGALIIQDLEDGHPEGQEWTLDQAALARGLQLMAQKQPRHFSDMLKEDDDAVTADVFLQLCLFGEVVYG